jgi:hypothetical protein
VTLADAAPPPAWIAAADRALGVAVDEVRLIRAVTAENAADEAARIESAWDAGLEPSPKLRYPTVAVRPELRDALERLALTVEDEGPLGMVYAERARELALEADMIGAVGSFALRKLAAKRFVRRGPGDADDRARADALAGTWAALAAEPQNGDRIVTSDDERDPESLVSRLRAEIGQRRLPMRVVVQPGLASLAATADGAIVVAAGRPMGTRDVARTVLHEVEAHALPRIRAIEQPIGIFAIGTASGLDDQEGRALVLERRGGFLVPSRLRELGFRHLAAAATLTGASFVEVARMLRERGAEPRSAARIAMRVQRGGGLAREIVYLPAFVRVGRALASDPVVEPVMARGRIAAEHARTVASTLGRRALEQDGARIE